MSASASRIERVGAVGSSCLALHDSATSLLWPRLTSARASSPPDSGTSSEAREQISQGKTRDGHSIHPPHIRPASPDDIGLRVFVPSRPPALRLVCGSYSSGRSFACGFLPRTRHHVAVAVRLGVPVIKVPRGLAPPRHFPIRFRVSVDSASQGAARHAWRTQHNGRRLTGHSQILLLSLRSIRRVQGNLRVTFFPRTRPIMTDHRRSWLIEFPNVFGKSWSGREDLNLRPLGPEPSASALNSE